MNPRCLLVGLSALTLTALSAPALAQSDLDLSDGPRVNAKQAPESFAALAKRLMPAVVNITTSQTIATGNFSFDEDDPLRRFNPFFGRDDDGFRREGSLGSGFVISDDGLIITNDHVINAADQIEVVFSDGRILRARLIGKDQETDLAVLKVDSPSPLPFVRLGDSDAAEVGDWVIAIGNPFGYGGSVSAGIISAKEREINSGRYDDFIQTDAAINRGNSGGPLFTLSGDVVGVNTAIISPSGGSVGIGFSIPANQVRQITDQLIQTGKVQRGWLGVDVQPVDEDLAATYGRSEAGGVIVVTVNEDGPAAAAGLKVGDLLVALNGTPIENTRGLSRLIADAGVGKQVAIELVRGRRTQTLTTTLGELDLDEESETEKEALPEVPLTSNGLGVALGAIDESARRQYGLSRDIKGALVQAVSPSGPSFGKLVKGDVIIEIGFDTVTTVRDVLASLEVAATQTPGQPLRIRVHRRGRDAFFSVTLVETS